MKSDLDAIYKSGLDAIYKFSLLSRLFTVGLCLVTGYLTLDYDVSSTLEFDVSSTLEFNISTAEAIAPALKAFVRWDAVYFVDIAENGYSREQQFAFFPGYPLLVYLLSCLSSFLPWSFLPAIPSTTRIVISGVLISNIAFILASGSLYKLALNLGFRPHTAKTAAILFCISPVSIFMSSIYTESIFAFFSIQGLLYLSSEQYLLSSLSFATSTLIRSNGILFSGFFIWKLIKQRQKSFIDLLYNAILSIIVVFPFVGFQYYGYLEFCTTTTNPRPWCSKTIPLIYSFVQQHYWNNGLLRYWTLQQLPNFILAFPTLFIYSFAIYEYISQDPSRFMTLGFIESKRNQPSGFGTNPHILPHVYLSLILLLYITFFAHVQIITRFLCWNPIGYLFIASRLNTKHKEKIGRYYLLYSIIYGTVGIVLFAAFLPPA